MTGEQRLPSDFRDTRAPATPPATDRLPPPPRPGVPVHLLVSRRSASALAALLAAVSAHDGLMRHPLRWRMPERARDTPATARLLARAALRDGGVVVAIGGDGTINAATQACWPLGVALGVLGNGTFNYFSRQQGLPEDLPSAVAALVQAIDRGQLRPVQVGQVNGQVFLVNASLGLYPRLLAEREVASRRFGRHRLVALLAGVGSLLRPQAGRRLRLHERDADGHEHQRLSLTSTLFVGNNALQLSQVGLASAADVHHGALGALTLAPGGVVAMARLLWRAARGRLDEDPAVDSFACTALTVAGAGAPQRTQVKVAFDGESAWMTLPLHFSVGAQPLWLLAPERQDAATRPHVAAAQPPAAAHPALAGRAWPA